MKRDGLKICGWFIDALQEPNTVDLGILKAPEGQKAEGNILVVNWNDGLYSVHTFEYKSDNDIPPAIHQAGFPY